MLIKTRRKKTNTLKTKPKPNNKTHKPNSLEEFLEVAPKWGTLEINLHQSIGRKKDAYSGLSSSRCPQYYK